ncbi:MAG: 50S ribosomal protein L9 [Pseudomonadota bacterium]|nr:50S ribosomal protein L9 [Pseudomonadota bacterium]MEC8467031.1 50S ribosomal protein L9 [Pseudomonadota bacterium]|tara:strand:- start:5349 stop:5789 length:441 start_codon:yes stop_codon:yes gene_type:complete
MQVILLERIARLGKMGETVDVKNGYARNFLLPQGKALPATKANQAKFEAQRKELEAASEAARKEAETLSAKFEEVSVTVARQASETGMLYGSVKPADIAAQLEGVEKSQIQIGEPMKELGEYEVRLALHPEVIVRIPVHVERQTSA